MVVVKVAQMVVRMVDVMVASLVHEMAVLMVVA